MICALDWIRPKDPPMSLGQASILATLQQRNPSLPVIPKSWSVNDPSFSASQVVEFVMDQVCSSPNETIHFALGAFVWNETFTQEIIKTLKHKHRFPGTIILGGPQVSYVKQGLEQYYPEADVFIRGYAEDALSRLFSQEEPVQGVHFAKYKDLGLSTPVELETLPSPFLSGLIPPQRFIRWETQRGCPYKCSFCQHRQVDTAYQQRRQFCKTRVLQEAEWITSHPIIQDVAVLDPTFNSGDQYLAVLESLVQGKYSGKLALQCRAEMVNDAFLDMVQQLNETAHVVLEFGLQTIHKEEQRIIERPNNMKKVERVLEQVRDKNVECEVSLIFGLPNQTLESFEQSVEFCKRLQVPTIHAFPLMLLRGTPLFDQKKELQLVESSDIKEIPLVERVVNSIPHVVSSPSFSLEDWQQMAAIATELEQHYNKKRKVQ